MKKINILSIFDGKSCLYLACERAEIQVDNYYASEIDKSAITISKKNYPHIKHIGGVETVESDDFIGIDILAGGSPCQGFSRAGNGLNFQHHSSKLFFEYVRLRNKYKPRFFLLENVVMKKEWENIITEYLGVSPILINSRLVSAQNRDRLYWVGELQEDGTYKKVEIDQPENRNIILKDIFDEIDTGSQYYINNNLFNRLVVEGGENHLKIRNATKQGYLEGYPGDSVIIDFPESKTKRGRVKSGKSGTLTTGCNMGVITDDLRIRKLTPTEYEKLQTVPVGYTEGVTDTQRYKMLGNGWTIEVIAHILRQLKF